MSKSDIPIVSDVGKATGKLFKSFMPDAPEAQPLPERGAEPADPEIKKRATVEFATRDALVKRQAAAAGAQRSENDADLLGYSTPKRRAASRQLLG